MGARIVGGLGSGGWNHSGRATVEGTAKLNIDALKRAGGLRAGVATSWRWSRGGETVASISVHAVADRVHLRYSVEANGLRRIVDNPVPIAQRPCQFGGHRPLFRSLCCGREVLNLHLRGGRFVCRTCARLTYASRRERERDRCLRAVNKLRQRLGGEAGMAHAIAARPKRMWQRTYARIVDEIQRHEGLACEELARWMHDMTRRRPSVKGFWR